MSELPSTKLSNRIRSLDLLRGFALLGILIMNIISFSNIGTGYLNPTIGAGIEGYNAYFHGFGHLFADMRFMSLFSILFGAGVVLFTGNVEKRGQKPAKYHYRRIILLLIFGMIHAYLIWMGDILVMYAICGSLVFLMRKWKIKRLLIVGSIFFLIPILFSLLTYYGNTMENLEEIFSFWNPSQENINAEIAAYTGSYMDQMPHRAMGAIELQTQYALIEQFWRVTSMMMLGMILFRNEVLSAIRKPLYYKKLIIFGFFPGLFISALGLYRSYELEWNGVWQMNIGHLHNYIASVLMAMGYIGIIMLWSQSNFLNGFKKSLEAVGRMAFTNYILTSLICTFIFYGHGFGLFARLDRLEQWYVVLGVWFLLLIISPIVLKRFSQGPLEWIWRKFTYL